MSKKVITRFAPSPTGFLHIGGARTALFNWLYARHHGGEMALRIEDTDRERSNDAATTAIKEGLTWLGLNWSGDVISQFERANRHAEIANQLVKDGKAYHCYTTPEELSAQREEARANNQSTRYNGYWRDRDSAQAPAGVKPVIRIKAPLSGETIVDDQVQGSVSFANKDLDDFVILRSDGTPTYMLAVVVDDYDMGVTHIIRGDDHLTNAARQILIYNAMEWEIPVMAHIPLIHGADGAKLSKRHGALGVEAYREMGYLPKALNNYLARLGWSHGDDEVMTMEDMISWFDICDVNKGASRFDFKKLEAINGVHMRNSDDNQLADTLLETLPFLPDGNDILTKITPDIDVKLRAAMPALKTRAKTLVELANGTAFLYANRPLPFDEKAQKLLNDEARALLPQIVQSLETIEEWTHDSVDGALRQFCEEKELKLGKVAQPVRAALTGMGASPGVFDVLAILGKEESLARIRDQF